MKQFSLIFHILLLAAVGLLYYFHFAADKKPVAKTAAMQPSLTPTKDSCANGHLVAYVELDSLYDNVGYIKQKQKELEAEQERLARQYQNDYQQLENEKDNFLKKGNAITQQEAEDFQAKLYQKQQDIENKKQNEAQEMASRRAKTMEEIQTNLRNFLNEYNADKRFGYIFATGTGLDYILYKDSAHNITPDVIAGLNKAFLQKSK